MKQLRPVRCSDPQIQTALNYIINGVNERTPRSAPGMLLSTTPNGWSLRPTQRRKGGGSGGIVRGYPFQVVAAGNANDGRPLITVATESRLSLSKRPGSETEITGLGQVFPIEINQMVYLEISFDITETFESAEIKVGAPWEGYDSPVRFNDGAEENKRQEKWFQLIAYTQAIPDPNPFPDSIVLRKNLVNPGPNDVFQLVQCVSTHLLLCRDCFEADTVQLTVPYFAPGPAPTT